MASCRKPITKKLINSPDTCVDDNLRGVIAIHPHLVLHPKHRVITVDMKHDTGRVAVLGGGGSGHEPFAAGYVGEGMLDGAVAGGVFASPPTGHILYAIAQLYKYNSGGVIVVIGNYTGDRLNFGKAIEKAKIAGIKVEGLIFGEDVASSHNKTGGRSMCGEVFIYKLCGAMALQRYDLEKIRAVAAEANKNMATLGVCLNACSLPGQPPLYDIADDEMELGAGVHGEAGIAKVKLGTAADVSKMIIDKIIAHMKLVPDDQVAVMVNNLGGTSYMEMNIMCAEVKSYLEQTGVHVGRVYSGAMKTSLEMRGVQVCLLRLREEWRRLLALPAAPWPAPWPAAPWPAPPGDRHEVDDGLLLATTGQKMKPGPRLSAAQQELFRACLQRIGGELALNVELLNRLDSGCGDGDCGTTMNKFADGILRYLDGARLERPARVLADLAEVAERDMGGTSGGIYSLGLSAASQALANAQDVSPDTWLSAWESAMRAISTYGGAEPGDRTMLDAMHTACISFRENMSGEWASTVPSILKAIEDGVQATAGMTPRAGRASYVSREYAASPDAGARAVALALCACFHVLSVHATTQ